MKTIIGKYNSADVYTDLIEESAEVQIKQLCDQPFTKDCRIAIMPDVHAGAGCVIGFTANLGDLVIPNLIGLDVVCSLFVSVRLRWTTGNWTILSTITFPQV